MSQSEKAGYYRALKDADVPMSKHYREYTTSELKQAYEHLVERQAAMAQHPSAPVEDYSPLGSTHGPPEVPAFDLPIAGEEPTPDYEELPDASFFGLQVKQADPEELPGQRQNSQPEDQPVRVDENGLVWFQEEIRKPAAPKPRARRVLRVADPGVKTQTIQVEGGYIESFEVAGNEVGRTSEIKVTMPTYQVGIFKDPRFPFRVHVYNGVQGFDLFEVQDYFGGAELVPAGVKRMYVSNVLCYDIRTTVRAIEDEYRRLQLAGKA